MLLLSPFGFSLCGCDEASFAYVVGHLLSHASFPARLRFVEHTCLTIMFFPAIYCFVVLSSSMFV
jgi:hypothetical protein